MTYTDEQADKIVKDLAARINDALAGEIIDHAVVGAICFSGMVAGRNACIDKEKFMQLADMFYESGSIERRKASH